jgi:hypothetical protein
MNPKEKGCELDSLEDIIYFSLYDVLMNSSSLNDVLMNSKEKRCELDSSVSG